MTKSRFMPPWLPQPGYGDFEEEHRVTDAQIKAIGDWVTAGMPEGDPSQTPSPPQFTRGYGLGLALERVRSHPRMLGSVQAIWQPCAENLLGHVTECSRINTRLFLV